jgi:hypothetical protein
LAPLSFILQSGLSPLVVSFLLFVRPCLTGALLGPCALSFRELCKILQQRDLSLRLVRYGERPQLARNAKDVGLRYLSLEARPSFGISWC